MATVPSQEITNWSFLNQNMHKGKCIYNENSPSAESRSGSRILLINGWPSFNWNDEYSPHGEHLTDWGYWVIDGDSDKQNRYPLANSPGISEPVSP